MSWRRFLILIRGLSQNSVLVGVIQSNKKKLEDVVDNPEEIEKAMNRIGW